MELLEVKPEDIIIPEIRVTARFDEETWEQFRSSMQGIGAIAPIICIKNEKGLFLVDGLHRLVEAKKNGEKLIKVAAIPGDEADVFTKNLFLDHLRGTPPVTDQIKVIDHLVTELHLDSEQIAEKTGLTRDHIEKLQRLSQLTPLCLAALDDGRIGVGQAYELTRIKDPITQEAVLHQVVLYRWKVADLKEYITDVLKIQAEQAAPPPPGQAPQVYLIECFYCHQKFEVTQIANPHTCRECSLTMLSAIARAREEAKREQEAKDE